MQQRPPTVGDTVTIVHRIVAAPGAMIEARPPADSTVATLIGPPVLTRDGDSVRISYTIAVWSAGHNDLVLPGAVVVDQRGHVDTLPDTHLGLDVASVLPAAKPTNAVPPKTAQPWLQAAERSELPFAVLLPLALTVGIALHWWWRRRGPEMPTDVATPTPPRLSEERIAAWLAAGEGAARARSSGVGRARPGRFRRVAGPRRQRSALHPVTMANGNDWCARAGFDSLPLSSLDPMRLSPGRSPRASCAAASRKASRTGDRLRAPLAPPAPARAALVVVAPTPAGSRRSRRE